MIENLNFPLCMGCGEVITADSDGRIRCVKCSKMYHLYCVRHCDFCFSSLLHYFLTEREYGTECEYHGYARKQYLGFHFHCCSNINCQLYKVIYPIFGYAIIMWKDIEVAHIMFNFTGIQRIGFARPYQVVENFSENQEFARNHFINIFWLNMKKIHKI